MIKIGKGVEICTGAIVTGEGYIGEGTTIGPYVVISDPKIGKHCVIGGAGIPVIERSTIGDNVNIKHHCGIRDCEVGDYANISEFVTIANFDGVSKKQTKIGSGVMLGVQVRIMGGVEIGDECFIADGARVSHDVPARTYFNPGKALIYPQLGAYRDNCAWYLYGNYLKLDRVIGPEDREHFLKGLKEKFGSEEEIKQWLRSPIDRMAGRTPLGCLRRDGHRAVYDILGEYVDKIFGHEIITKREISREKKKLLESELKSRLADPRLWMATPLSSGLFCGFTPIEILEMEGECMIPLLIKWAQEKSII